MPRLTRAITWTPMGGFGVTSFSTTIITTPPEKRSILWKKGVHRSGTVPETRRLDAKAHGSCSRGQKSKQTIGFRKDRAASELKTSQII